MVGTAKAVVSSLASEGNRPLRVTFERHGFAMAVTIGAATPVVIGADGGFPMKLQLD